TLVHGSYKPRHILVDGGPRALRVCPVDWELAAAGSPLYDLAFLAHGMRRPALDRLFDAYHAESIAHGAPPIERDEMRRALDSFRLHRVLKALASADERRVPERKI